MSKSTHNTNLTNAANERINKATNESNQLIARETNAANIAMNNANNDLQRLLQEEMNEYNSIGSQLERGAQAGVNPNAILSGVSGNLQNTLPSVNAGHADMIPNQSFEYQNPYQEKLGVLDLLSRGASGVADAIEKGAHSDLLKAQAQNQYTVNQFQSDLSKWQVHLSKSQVISTYQGVQFMMSQQKVNDNLVNQIKANVAVQNEQQRSLWLDNYFKQDSYNSFNASAKKYLVANGIPKDEIDDNLIHSMYYGVLPQLGITLNERQLAIMKQNETAESIKVMKTVEALNSAKTEREKAETVILNETGVESAKQGIEESKERVKSSAQGRAERNYLTSPTAQGVLLRGLILQNLNTQANTEATKTHAKNESINTGMNVAKGTSDILNQWLNPFK